MTNIISTDNLLSEQQKEMLAIVVDMMIPAEGEMPSAADPLIMNAIIEGLGDNGSLVVLGLSTLEDLSGKKYGQLFARLESGQRDEPAGFNWTISCWCGSRDQQPPYQRYRVLPIVIGKRPTRPHRHGPSTDSR